MAARKPPEPVRRRKTTRPPPLTFAAWLAEHGSSPNWHRDYRAWTAAVRAYARAHDLDAFVLMHPTKEKP